MHRLDLLIEVADGVAVRQVGDLRLGRGQLIGQFALLVRDGGAVGTLEDVAARGDVVAHQQIDEIGGDLRISVPQLDFDGVGLGHVLDLQIATQLFQRHVHAGVAAARLRIDPRQADLVQRLFTQFTRAQNLHFGMDDLGAVECLGIAGRVVADGAAEHIFVTQQDQQSRLGSVDRLGQGRGGQRKDDRDQKGDQRLAPVIEDRGRKFADRDRQAGAGRRAVVQICQRLIGQYAGSEQGDPAKEGGWRPSCVHKALSRVQNASPPLALGRKVRKMRHAAEPESARDLESRCPPGADA